MSNTHICADRELISREWMNVFPSINGTHKSHCPFAVPFGFSIFKKRNNLSSESASLGMIGEVFLKGCNIIWFHHRIIVQKDKPLSLCLLNSTVTRKRESLLRLQKIVVVGSLIILYKSLTLSSRIVRRVVVNENYFPAFFNRV